MPRVIAIEDDTVASLEECCEALAEQGFAPDEEESLHHAARQLRRLGNDQNFLGDILVRELAQGHGEDDGENSYGPQVIMLRPPGDSDFFIRANIWPSADEHAMRASGGAAFVYSLPHDHNFSFLTLGYFGPGYWSNYYEFDYEDVAGCCGESVDLRFVERSQLTPGKLQLYRAHIDVHDQEPGEALSVSLNIMHTCGAQGWLDQYSFDLERKSVGRIISNGSSEAFMRIAVGLGSEEARDLAWSFGGAHPSDRMRLASWSALAATETDAAARDAVWSRAELSGSRLVVAEAGRRRAELL